MTFESDDQAAEYIRLHQEIPKTIVAGRKEARELYALIEGVGFDDELIKRIEHIEDAEKAKARRKYSRNIVDLYERLLQPISNVFSASGSSKKYDITNDEKLTEFLLKISNLRDNKSIQKYVENTWMPLYHVDPNGVIFMEYTTKKEVDDGGGSTKTVGTNDVYPTYKSIYSIRSYKPKGQLVDVILFEPKKQTIKNAEGLIVRQGMIWRIVDDVWDRTFLQDGDTVTLIPEKSFEHPFKEVPAIINSDIVKIGSFDFKVSPINKIKDLTREYARDQSVKTLYKFLQGFPIFWRYITECRKCKGVGKDGNKKCTDCNGVGFYKKKDVTDQVTLPAPKRKDDVKIAPDIAGYISPDLETWRQYSDELELLEDLAVRTHWGTHKEKGKNETATGRWIDIQPVMNRLNKYADTAEWVERQLSEWIALYLNPSLDGNVAAVHYGRRYIIESPDVILEKYQLAREKGANNVILDRLYNEYLTSKYGNDPQWLRVELLKSEVEPYLHIGLEQVAATFGQVEAQRKVLFTQWWKTLDTKAQEQDAEKLIKDYITWFDANKVKLEPETPAQGDN